MSDVMLHRFIVGTEEGLEEIKFLHLKTERGDSKSSIYLDRVMVEDKTEQKRLDIIY